MTEIIINLTMTGNNSMTEVINMKVTGNDILKIIEIIAAGILVAVIGAFAAYRFTCGRSAYKEINKVNDRELDTYLNDGGGDLGKGLAGADADKLLKRKPRHDLLQKVDGYSSEEDDDSNSYSDSRSDEDTRKGKDLEKRDEDDDKKKNKSGDDSSSNDEYGSQRNCLSSEEDDDDSDWYWDSGSDEDTMVPVHFRKKEAEVNEEKSKTDTIGSSPQGDGTASRYIMHGLKSREKNREEDGDMHVARSIMQNKKYSISGQDDEYDNDEGHKRKKWGKGDNNAAPKPARFVKCILTQQERCNFCIENPKRPHHLVIAIANFTYMMLPQWQPVVPGHCCILPMQNLATSCVDDNVWVEIRNFKKCLRQMFAKQEKEVVFLETVMGLAKQSRHCMIECIPLARKVAEQAPLYFKKAIDEAEKDNAKKLFDTSEKGLRHSIPPDLPYFLVEFGLEKGYVLVINDESQFKSSFGSNVVRKMCHLPEEDMHLPDRRDSLDSQKEAVADFRRDWDSFDWTKQLD